MLHSFVVESLEHRQLLSAGLTPAQVHHAYGFDHVTFGDAELVQQPKGKHARRNAATAKGPAPDGSGQTIAIVGAFHTPTIEHDLAVFDKRFKISATDVSGQPVLTVATPAGQPPVDAGWASENTLDVEWAHASAPKAHILLVEAMSHSTTDLLAAVDYARHQPGVTVVSMSWSFAELPSDPASNGIFTTPAGHAGVTFVAAAGDGAGIPGWPAASPNVISVGGTSLRVSGGGNWRSKIAWSGGGGGRSTIQQSNTPDVAYDADPQRGFAMFDSTADGKYKGWQVLGGTSAGAPQWAALIAIANQGRALRGKGSLDGVARTKPVLHAAPQDHFHDIVTGSNGFPAGPGYDFATGRGSPIANLLIQDLMDS
jgi:subtilase family serine protease